MLTSLCYPLLRLARLVLMPFITAGPQKVPQKPAARIEGSHTQQHIVPRALFLPCLTQAPLEPHTRAKSLQARGAFISGFLGYPGHDSALSNPRRWGVKGCSKSLQQDLWKNLYICNFRSLGDILEWCRTRNVVELAPGRTLPVGKEE